MEFKGQVRQVINGSHVQPGVGDGEDELTAAVSEILYQGNYGMFVAAVLEQAVQASDTDFGATFLDLAGYVCGALEKDLDSRKGGNVGGIAAGAGTADSEAAVLEEIKGRVVELAVAGQDEVESVVAVVVFVHFCGENGP